jgi:hypothetical protein
MKQQAIFTVFTACLVTVLGLSGCTAGNQSSSGSSASTSNTSPSSGTVNLVVQDTPPTGITVLSFQLQIASATLQPGNISILPRPVTVDLAQLVTDTGFLASQVVDSGTYTSLTMTYQNPQITLMNSSTAPLVTPAGTCAVGQVCTFTPRLNNASVTISSGVIPVTVTANSTTGFNMDLSISDLLQSDLSLNFANGQSVNFSLLAGLASLTNQQSEIDAVLATVKSVSGAQTTIQTALGDSLTIDLNATTTYHYPSAVCSCLLRGDAGLLRSCLENVIRNAVRFAPAATVVRVTLDKAQKENLPIAVVTVQDAGKGVPEEALSRLFEPFYRVAVEDDMGGNQGTGLGLSISRRIVTLYGGAIHARNGEHGGLVVVIEFPLG